MKRRNPSLFPLLAAWFVLVLLACNITAPPPPPSVVPRATATPPPTIGYSTLAPNELPEGVTQIAPNVVAPDFTLINLLNQVNADSLFVTIDTMVNMQTRRVNSSGIESAATYITNAFNRIREGAYQNNFSVTPQQFPINFDGTQSTGNNIVGIIQGTDVNAGVIILGAHYDSISYNFTDSGAFAPGANDNASGVAAMLEIARIMSLRPHRSTIIFVAFSAEEIQRAGSIAFVEGYLQANPNIDVRAMINMDIIGSSTSADLSVNENEIRLYSADPNESRSRQLARALNLIAKFHALDMRIVVQGSVDREGRYSDHMSFSDAGYPAVRFIESLEDFSRQHSDRDTIDAVRVGYLLRGTQTILACMTALADGLPPPQNIVLRAAGGSDRVLVYERVPGASAYIVALRRPDGLIYSDYFTTSEINTTWDGFYGANYASLAVASVDETGLIGPLSFEFGIAP